MKGLNLKWTRSLIYMIKYKQDKLLTENMLSEKPRSGLSETRKMTKSTMEKKRRARINNSLTELKSILSGMITNKGERFDKMEKADILEMTVKCVRQLQKQAHTGDPSRLTNVPGDEDYRSGMHTCMSEVIKFISSSSFSDTDPGVKTKLLDHLANKLHSGTNQRTNTEPDVPRPYKKYSHENDTDITDIDSGSLPTSNMSNDSNNNSQTINDKNSTLDTHVNAHKSPRETSPMPSPVFSPYKQIQPLLDTVQQAQSVPTVPLTILVPANICSAAVGTTCVIPLNLPTASPQIGQNSVLATVTQPSQTNFAINSGSGISLISASNFLPNTQISSKVNDIINLSPEGRVYTFTPTVLSDNHRTPDNTFKVNDAVKPSAVPPPLFHTPGDEEGPTTLNLNNKPGSISTSLLNHQKDVSVNETRSQHNTAVPVSVPRVTHVNENCTQNLTLKCSFENTSTKELSQTIQDQIRLERRTTEQEHAQGQGNMTLSEQRQLIDTNSNATQSGRRSIMYNSKPGNVCDNANPSMWRPW